jgi:hypothetical protein
MKLDQWSVGRHKREDAWTPPEMVRPCLRGVVSGHPQRKDGTMLCTSPIVGVTSTAAVTESGSVYELGEVDPEYEAAFPDARNRLFSSYPNVEGESQ